MENTKIIPEKRYFLGRPEGTRFAAFSRKIREIFFYGKTGKRLKKSTLQRILFGYSG
ncbi:MAG: hypothetical protein IKG08_02865 [Eubacterium sp.]|nr:hypothetical protein [Eubacterium sp.]